MFDEVSAEVLVLLDHAVVRERTNEEEDDEGAENGEAAANPEGTSVALVSSRTAEVFDDWGEGCRRKAILVYRSDDGIGEKKRTPGTNESTNFSNGSSETVELTTDSGGASLGSQQTKAVTRAKFAKAEEDPVDDGECTDVVRKLDIEAAHDEADDGLAEQTENLCRRRDIQSVFGADDESVYSPWCTWDPCSQR